MALTHLVALGFHVRIEELQFLENLPFLDRVPTPDSKILHFN